MVVSEMTRPQWWSNPGNGVGIVHNPTPAAAIHNHGGRSDDGFGQRSRRRRLFPEDFGVGHVQGRGETGVDDSERVRWRPADTAVENTPRCDASCSC